MKKLLLFTLIALTTTQFCYAITVEDKAAIRAEIDEIYKYCGNSAPVEAKDKAKIYVYNQYFYTFQKCRAACETEREATETYTSCYEKKCRDIKDVQMKECYNYIDEYIEYKNKTRKK
nr:MAG TPA: hypothetical protein [Caudoviricetes sp.]